MEGRAMPTIRRSISSAALELIASHETAAQGLRPVDTMGRAAPQQAAAICVAREVMTMDPRRPDTTATLRGVLDKPEFADLRHVPPPGIEICRIGIGQAPGANAKFGPLNETRRPHDGT
jgi:hypothetical protein